ncbi:phage tail length tape measure family protein [[Pseudomonas] boreopolis]|uniref:Phage tail tape measure protein n=1 Tax=Xanthomonas boreopolis TaxID=86183 RepID=A0A919F801_9XANT|nr:phage tail tape measure protein [[Pseudomonas] boreopolis]
MADPSANLRVRISADLNDIKQGLAVLRGQVSQFRKEAGAPLPSRTGLKETGEQARGAARDIAMVAPQLTDFFTQIASGQGFLLPLIQQGGQLRDVFGGTGPALKATGAALVSIINPATLTAAAIGALAFAWKSAEDANFEFEKALISTGGYAGKSSDQLKALVAQLDQLDTVSRSGAAEAVLKVAQTGQFAGEQFDRVAASAAMMQSAAGQSIDDTISKFREIAKDPVQALLKLNEAEHVLSRAQLDRINTLIDEGNKQQAVAEAIALYDDHLEEVARRSREAMPAMTQWWLDVKDAISGAWGELQTYVELVGKAVQAQGKLSFGPGGAVQGLGMAQGNLASLVPSNYLRSAGMLTDALAKRFLRDAANPGGTAPAAAPQNTAVDSEAEKARLKFQEDTNRLLGQTLDLEGRIKKMREDARKDGIVDEKLLAERERALRQADAKRTAKSTSSLLGAQRTAGLQSIRDEYGIDSARLQAETSVVQAQYQARQISAETYYGKLKDLAARSTEAEVGSIEKQIAYLKEHSAAGREGVAVNQQLATLEAQLTKVRIEGAARQQELTAQETKATEARRLAIQAYGEALQASNDALAQQMQAMVAKVGMGEREYEIQQRINEVYADQADKLRELQMQLNAGQIDQPRFEAERLVLMDKTAERLDIIRNGYSELASAERDWLKGAQAAWSNYTQEASNAAGQMGSLVTSIFTGLEDVWARFTTNGKLRFRDFANAVISDLARIAFRQAVVGMVGSIGKSAVPESPYWAEGGYTGDGGKYEPAGIVHKGEGVLSQEDIASIGGPSAFMQLLATIRGRRGRGYSSGGLAGATGSAPRVGAGTSIQIINQGQPISVLSEQRQRQPDGSELIKLIVGTMQDDFANGGPALAALKSRTGLQDAI